MAEHAGLSLDFSGRKVLITGGASGIGKATAKTFLNLGASVIAVDWNQETLDVLKAEHAEITTIRADVSDWNGLEMALASHHPIHHLVNNAGIIGPKSPLALVTEEGFDKIIGVNLKSVIRMSQLVSRGMIEAKLEGATIVNISSIEAGVSCSQPDAMIYGASKAAILAVTRNMAHELAPHKIRVNALRPGCVKTEIWTQLNPDLLKIALSTNIERQVYHQDLMGPQSIANNIVYLSSPISDMVTGTTITVDAGFDLA